MNSKSLVQKAIDDLFESWRWRRVILYYAYNEIKLRYRGSAIGPFWLVLNTLIQISTLSIIYTRVFNIDAGEYIKWITCGIIPWGFIAASITDGCTLYKVSRKIYSNQKIPMSFFAYKLIVVNNIIFLHQLPIYVLVVLFFHIPITLFGLINIILGIACVSFICLCIVIVIGILSERFHDIPQIITNIMNLAFLATPIIWIPKLIPKGELIAQFNPLYYMVQAIRAPLMGETLSLFELQMVIGISVVMGIFAFTLFTRCRHRIVFWG